MDVVGDISVWLTPAIIIGLFLWLRADIRALEGRVEKRFGGLDKRMDGLEERLEKRFDGLDERLRAVEAGQSEIRGQLSFVRDYVVSRNLREPETAAEGAPGD